MDNYGFNRAFKAEWLKLKGSGIWLMAILLGLAFPFINLVSHFFENDSWYNTQSARLPFSWFKQLLDKLLAGFGQLFYPVALILLAARIAALDHKTDTWKLMETQPISRFSIWSSKWLVAILLSAVVVFTFFAGTVLLGSFTWIFKTPPDEAIFSLPIGYFSQLAFRIWLSGLGLLSLQFGLSVLIRSTIWPIIIGVGALIVTGIAAANSAGFASTFWPYSLPAYTTTYPGGSELGKWLLPAEWQSIAWVLLVPLLFLCYEKRGRIKQAFMKWKLAALPVTAIFCLAALSYFIQRPKKIELLQGRTVIAGIIKSDSLPLPDSIGIYSWPLQLEIAKVAIDADGSFRKNLTFEGAVQEIVIRISFNHVKFIHLGEGDSVFLNWTIGKVPGLQEVDVTGTAIATHQFMKNSGRGSYSSLQYMLEYQPTQLPEPAPFFDQLMDEWKEKAKLPAIFRTADGYGLGSVFRTIQEKLIAVRYIDYALLQYPEQTKKSFNDITIQQHLHKLQPLLNTIAEFDSTLVGWDAYHTFLNKWLVRDLPLTANKDSAYNERLLLQSAGPTRDRLLYELTKNKLALTRDSTSRAVILKQVINITDAQFKLALQKQNDILNSLRLGRAAPIFEAHLSDDSPVNLSDLQGKYLAVDVWATWCGPCRKQSPIFEQMAEKYKDQPITFVALSVDENRGLWEQYLRNNFSRIAQWRANNMMEIKELYGLESIPRFMLIDPDGKFVNAQMPMPEDANFELILRQALGLKAQEG